MTFGLVLPVVHLASDLSFSNILLVPSLTSLGFVLLFCLYLCGKGPQPFDFQPVSLCNGYCTFSSENWASHTLQYFDYSQFNQNEKGVY